MTHFFSFRFKVTRILLTWSYFKRYPFNNLKPISFKSYYFPRVICHEANFPYTNVGQYLCSDSIITQIRRKSKLLICFNSIQTLILKSISLEFIYQPDPTPFLTQIQNHSTSITYLFHCPVKLFAAVTSARPKKITCETL